MYENINTFAKCSENEHFTKCGTTCPLTCSNYYKKPQRCTKDCFVGCECDEGFVRNEETNECVTPIQCPRNVTHDCPENEHFDECGTACPITCNNYFDPPKVCTMQCVVGCVCDKAFVRNEDTGKCVLAVECPRNTTSRPGTTPRCPKNMVYTNCKSACEPRCGIPLDKASGICTLECAGEGCECRAPFALDELGNCVEREKCKKSPTGGYYIIHMLRKTVTTMYTLIFRH
uniref:TIL domain-containing protein n=1 Tax=Strongyloides papillosus TaxID=174720 RepID=A0A0N5BKS8_STREA